MQLISQTSKQEKNVTLQMFTFWQIFNSSPKTCDFISTLQMSSSEQPGDAKFSGFKNEFQRRVFCLQVVLEKYFPSCSFQFPLFGLKRVHEVKQKNENGHFWVIKQTVFLTASNLSEICFEHWMHFCHCRKKMWTRTDLPVVGKRASNDIRKCFQR